MLNSEYVARARRVEIIRQHTKDIVLSAATPAEMAASATSRADLGVVYNGLNTALAREGVGDQARAQALDAVGEIVEKYLGGRSGWPVAANGTAFTSANNTGSASEQGSPAGTQDAVRLRHLDADCRRGMSIIAQMQRNNLASR